jgi:hypothetical protein
VRRRGPAPAIPSSDLAALARPVRRTALLRAGLALLLAALLAAEVAIARGGEVREAGFVPRGTSTVLVVDVSKSVEDGSVYRLISDALERLVELEEPVGLVFFSDVAYELLPPGSPASALEPFVPYFTPRQQAEQDPDSLVGPNPWSDALSGGTKISFGLETARAALLRDAVESPSMVLLSDLDTASADRPRLTESLVRIVEEGIRLRVVPLGATSEGRAFFEGVVGPEAFVSPAELTGEAERRVARRLEAGSPEPLVLAGGLLLLLLAVNERLLARVPVPRGRRSP